jgi:hypothetical protein
VTYQRLLSLSKHEDVVVVDIDITVNFSLLLDAGGDIAPGLARFRNVLEHFCVLIPIHKATFAAMRRVLSMRVHDAIAQSRMRQPRHATV